MRECFIVLYTTQAKAMALAAAVRIQAWFRMQFLRPEFSQRLSRMRAAAVRIQAVYRGCGPRRAFQRVLHARQLEREKAVRWLQRRWRGIKGRELAEQLALERRERMAATTVGCSADRLIGVLACWLPCMVSDRSVVDWLVGW